jgi:hypothetical protein
VDALDAAETKRLLATILEAHPELLDEVAELADAQLADVTPEDVAEDVVFALGGLCVEDIWDRSGTQRDGEYVEPTEAAWAVVEEAASPFIADLERRLELGRGEEAAAVCQGTLLGLYRLSRQEGEFLGGWAPDSLEGVAGLAVETWKKRRKGRTSIGAARTRELGAMREFVSEVLPEWRSFLTRILGPAPKATRKRSKR